MADLPKDWPIAGPLDFEYQTYTLLAYLQSVNQQFDCRKLYPILTELIRHYRQVQKLQQEKEALQHSMPKTVKGLDLKNFEIKYEMEPGEDWVKEIDAILDYALPRMYASLDTGRHIFDQLMQELVVEAIGIVPIRKDEGYVFIQNGETKQLSIYQFHYRSFSDSGERFGSLQWEYLEEQELSLLNTVDSLKRDIIGRFRDLPNPATYWLKSQQAIPYKETLIPLAKRRILRTLVPQAA